MRNAHSRAAAVFGPIVNVSEPIAGNETSLGSLGYPILDSLNGEGDAVGILSTVFNWSGLFQDVLPSQAQGITCVLRNTCEQTLTLEVNGGDVALIGHGDYHDSRFSNYAATFVLADGLVDLPDRTVSRVPFDDESPCQYTLTIYPSASTEAMYDSSGTKKAAIATAVIFIFVLVIFGLYDFLHERRNRKVKRTAQDARAIVSSLFPANVRDRLFETNREKRRQRKKAKKREKLRRRKEKRRRKKARKKSQEAAPDETVGSSNETKLDNELGNRRLSNETLQQIITELVDESAMENGDLTGSSTRNLNGVVSHPKHRLKSYLNDSPLAARSGFSQHDIAEEMAKPIADLFPQTTVLFADIV
ncbi:MAG: hypothetical protein SGARI_001699, partial [Bacillariaceae sp.]